MILKKMQFLKLFGKCERTEIVFEKVLERVSEKVFGVRTKLRYYKDFRRKFISSRNGRNRNSNRMIDCRFINIRFINIRSK